MSIDGEVRLHHPSFEDDVEEGAPDVPVRLDGREKINRTADCMSSNFQLE